ncbi:hypothetical protein BGZ94_009176 [Podila epigama]|nr:hypothetical protein BGZ94_009176 [Podila epigama]
MSAQQLEAHLDRAGLKLVNDSHKYRKVVASKLIRKGTTIITSRPLCNPILFPTHRSQHCETCFRTKGTSPDKQGRTPLETLERCSVCKKRYYCDRECFTVAWKGWHRWICPDKDLENLDYEMLKMVVISIERLRNGSSLSLPENNSCIQDNEPLELTEYVFSTLMGHEAVSDHVQLSKYREIATFVRDQLIKSKFPFKSAQSQKSSGQGPYTSHDNSQSTIQHTTKTGQPPSIQELMQYLCRFHCNNFSIHDSQLFTIAEGTFPIGALFNHSCRPNAIVMYEGQVQVVRALEDIAVGQEVCTSYVDNGVQRKERRLLLLEKYFFHCQCPRCVQEGELEENGEESQVGVPGRDEGVTHKAPETQGTKWTGYRLLDELIEGNDDGPEGGKVDGEWLTRQFEPIVLPNAQSLRTAGPAIQAPKLVTRASFTSYLIHSLVPLIQTEADEALYQERLFDIYAQLRVAPHCRPKPFTTTVMTNATSFFNTCLEHGSWVLGSKIGMFILALYLMIYPRHHPLMGLHCFTLAKCLWNDVEGGLASVRLSHEMVLLTQRILQVSHGPRGQNGLLLQEVQTFRKTVEMELH